MRFVRFLPALILTGCMAVALPAAADAKTVGENHFNTNSIGKHYGKHYGKHHGKHFNRPTNHVPEPGTLALFGLGLAGLGLVRRRRAI